MEELEKGLSISDAFDVMSLSHESDEVKISEINNGEKQLKEEASLIQGAITHFESGTVLRGSPGTSNALVLKELVPAYKKLLVLDINGLLADISSDYSSGRCADFKIRGKSVYKRPFCDEFLDFCFANFEIGIWSSRQKHNLEPAVDFLIGDLKNKLLFCWDQSKCTATNLNTIDFPNKPLFLKELKKLWEKDDSDLPWEKRRFTPFNTLLVDDSPYKALRNPPYTAVFPHPYRFKNNEDNSLGKGGELRVYLQKVAAAKNVQYYVKNNPFGQLAITDSVGLFINNQNKYWAAVPVCKEEFCGSKRQFY